MSPNHRELVLGREACQHREGGSTSTLPSYYATLVSGLERRAGRPCEHYAVIRSVAPVAVMATAGEPLRSRPTGKARTQVERGATARFPVTARRFAGEPTPHSCLGIESRTARCGREGRVVTMIMMHEHRMVVHKHKTVSDSR